MTGGDKQGLRLLPSIMFTGFGIVGILFSIFLLIAGTETAAAFAFFGTGAVFAVVGIILKHNNRKSCQKRGSPGTEKAAETSAKSENPLEKEAETSQPDEEKKPALYVTEKPANNIPGKATGKTTDQPIPSVSDRAKKETADKASTDAKAADAKAAAAAKAAARKVLIMLILGSLGLGCAAYSDNDSTGVIAPTDGYVTGESSFAAGFSATGTLALYSVSSETPIRYLAVTSADLSMNSGDQYLSFVFQLQNVSSAAKKLTDVHCMIDDSVRGDWVDFELAAGERTDLHVYNCNMIKLAPGLHLIQLYANGEQLAFQYFSLDDDWSSLMSRPSETEIAAYDRTATERSPYASLYMGFGSNTFSEVSVDFKADDQPDYTYVCPVSWWMDTSCIADQYRTIDASRAAYCGFQTTEHGKIAIMSIWDTAYTDKDGNTGLIKATLTYHKPDTEYLKVAEGDEQGNYTSSHASCLLSYDWQEGHWYRTLLQCGTSEETGNKTISFWVCDLENNTWELLMVFDLGVKDTHITSISSFLECYSPSSAGEVRTMELANPRVYNYTNGRWEDPSYIYCDPGACVDPALGGSGSCQVGCDGYTFRVITSGISGLTDKETDTSRFSIKSRDPVPPYGLW